MHRNGLAGLVFATLALVACGRDSAAPGPGLTDSEARSLAASFSGMAGSYALTASAGSAGIASALGGGISVSYTAELKCPAGGTVTPDLQITGNFDKVTNSGVFDVTGKETLKDCANTTDAQTITATGTLTSTSHVSIVNGKPGTVSATEKGSFDWRKSDGTSGTCAVDLSAIVDATTLKATVTGTFCGRGIS